MSNKKPTLIKTTNTSNVINDFEKFNWQKDVNKGRLTNNDIESTKHLYRKKYLTTSIVIISILLIISVITVLYLWYTWGDDHTLNEYLTSTKIEKNLETVQAKYDEMKNTYSADFTNEDTDHLVNRLSHYMFFKSNYLTNNPNDFYNNFSRTYSSKYTNLINEIDNVIAQTKTSIKNNIASDINSINYDASLFDNNGNINATTQLLPSDTYNQQLSDLTSQLNAVTAYQNMYNLLEQQDFNNLKTVYSDKFEHIKLLYIASIKQETQTASSDTIKKAYEDEYNTKLKESQDAYNAKITEKENKIKELEKEIESLKNTSSAQGSISSSNSKTNNSTDNKTYN